MLKVKALIYEIVSYFLGTYLFNTTQERFEDLRRALEDDLEVKIFLGDGADEIPHEPEDFVFSFKSVKVIISPRADLSKALVKGTPLEVLLPKMMRELYRDIQMTLKALLTSWFYDMGRFTEKLRELLDGILNEHLIIDKLSSYKDEMRTFHLSTYSDLSLERSFYPIYSSILNLIAEIGGEADFLILSGDSNLLISEEGRSFYLRDLDEKPRLLIDGSLIPVTTKGKLIGAALLPKWLPWKVLVVLQLLLNLSADMNSILKLVRREIVSKDNLLKLIKALGATMRLENVLRVILDIGITILGADIGVLSLKGIDQIVLYSPDVASDLERSTRVTKVMNSSLPIYLKLLLKGERELEIFPLENEYDLAIGRIEGRDFIAFLVRKGLQDHQEIVKLLEVLIRSTKLALETNEILNSLVIRTLQLKRILDFSKRVIAPLDIDSVISEIFSWISQEFNIDLIAYLHFNKDKRIFQIQYLKEISYNLPEDVHQFFKEARLAYVDVPSEILRSLRKGEVLVFPRDYSKFVSGEESPDPIRNFREFFKLLGFERFTLIPFSFEGEIKGLLYLGGYSPSRGEEDVLVSLGTIASIAISRAILWEILNYKYELSEILNRLVLEALEGATITDFLRKASESLVNLMPRLSVGLYIPRDDGLTFLDSFTSDEERRGDYREFFQKFLYALLHKGIIARKLLPSLRSEQEESIQAFQRMRVLENLRLFLDEPELYSLTKKLNLRAIATLLLISQEGRIVGIIAVVSPDTVFEDREMENLRTFNYSVSLVINNLLTYQSLKDKLDQLTRTYDLIRELCQENEEISFLKKVLRYLKDYFNSYKPICYSLTNHRWREIEGSADRSFQFNSKLREELLKLIKSEERALRSGEVLHFSLSLLRTRGFKAIYDYLSEMEASNLVVCPISAYSQLYEVIFLPVFRKHLDKDSLAFPQIVVMPVVGLLWQAMLKLHHERETAEVLRRNLLLDIQVLEDIKRRYPLEIGLKYVPAKELTADYLDFIPISKEKLLVVLSDVSGKGPESAIYTVQVKYALKALASITDDLAFIAGKLNQMISESSPIEKYLTAFLGVFDFQREELRYVLCGHEPPILVRSGEVRELRSGEFLPLGMFEDAKYDVERLKLKPGDLLFIYSDGLTEAKNPRGELFGDERVRNFLKRYSDESPNMIVMRLYRSVKLFTGGRGLRDDLSLVAIRFKGDSLMDLKKWYNNRGG